MNYFRNQKLLVFSVIILVAINLISLGSFWFYSQKFHHPPHFEGRKDIMQKFLVRELGLSKEQEDKLIRDEKEFLPKLEIAFEKMHQGKIELYGKIFETTKDSTKVDSLFRNIANYHAEIEKLLYFHFSEIKNICDPVQQEKLKNIQSRFLNFMDGSIKQHRQGNSGLPWDDDDD